MPNAQTALRSVNSFSQITDWSLKLFNLKVKTQFRRSLESQSILEKAILDLKCTDILQLSQIVWTKILLVPKIWGISVKVRILGKEPIREKIRIIVKKCESLRKGKRMVAKKCRQSWRTLSYCGSGSRAQSRHPLTRPSPSSTSLFSRPHSPPSSLLEASHHGYPEITASRSGNLSGTFQSLPRECSIKYYPSRHPGNYGLHAGNANSPPKGT